MSTPVEASTPPRLRPLSIGDLLDEAVRLYRRNWIKFVTIVAIVMVPVALLQVGFTLFSATALTSADYTRYAGDFTTRYWVTQGGQLVISLINVVLSAFMVGALVYVAGQSYVGQTVTTGQAYQLSLRRFLVMLGTSLVGLFIFVILGLFTIVPCVGWLGGPAAMIYAAVNLSMLIMPVIMLEGRGVFASLKRSWVLSKSQFWRILLIMVVLYFFNMAMVAGPTYLVMFLALALAKSTTLASAVTVAVSSLVSLVFTPIQGVCMTLLYYDARVRREALDLDLIAGTEVTPADTNEPLLVRSDWKTLGILTLVSIPAFVVLSFGGWVLLAGLMMGMRGVP